MPSQLPRSLVHMQMQAKELKALVSLVADDDRDVRDEVENHIRLLGEKIIPFLETEWEESMDPDVQRRLMDLIHTLQFEQMYKGLQEWANSGGEDLLEGMWRLTTYMYPDLELAKLKRSLEQIYYEMWLEVRPDMHPFDQIKVINDVLFRKLRFSANTKNFHAPNNSMLNVVLESKKGNPISLCIIYMLVCQKLKIPVYGVNLPNLFILTYKGEGTQFYINAFNRGVIFRKDDIDNYINNLNLKPNDVFYEPCSNVEIAKRVLRNLIVAFEKTGDTDKVEEMRMVLNKVFGEEVLE